MVSLRNLLSLVVRGTGSAALALILLGAGSAFAQGYPTKPVRLLVPNAAGGGLDVIARIISPKLSEGLGKSVIVDNRTGASGSIALELTARATPDGYTLSMFSAGQVGHAAVNKTSYDLLRDFAHVTQVSAAPYVLAVSNGMPMKSVADLIAHAKANPGKLNYASSGHATLQHLVTELFGVTVGVKLVHIPYKGVAAAFPDLLSGRTHLTISSAASLSGQIRAGGLRPLAVTSAQRMKTLPEVPTMIESGLPGFVVTQWHGILAAAKTPPAVVQRLHREVVNAVAQADVVSRLAADGAEPIASTPAEFTAFVKSEFAKYTAVIKQTGIQPE